MWRPLTADHLRARSAGLADPEQDETRHFVRVYGAAHAAQVLAWLRRAAAEA